MWKDIDGYQGLYQISNTGKVKSLDRMVTFAKGQRLVKAKIIRPRINRGGYVEIRLSKGGICSSKSLHVLSGIAFIPNPHNKKEINHKNGIKADNRLCNLEWVTHSENMQHAYRTGLIKSKTKKVIDTCTGDTFSSSKEAAAFHRIKHNTLRGYLNGQTKNKTCMQYQLAA